MKINVKLVFYVFLITFNEYTSINCLITRNIPYYLLRCYQNGEMVYNAPKTVQLLVDLIDKIEVTNFNHNIRTLSTALLHRLRLDGIEQGLGIPETEFVVPYQASAFQFSKFNLLLDMLIPDEQIEDLWTNLDDTQLCTLHHLISSRVDSWERGDERKTCPLSMENEKPGDWFQNDNFVLQKKINTTSGYSMPSFSRCPKESGIVYTTWGDISPGTLIAAVSAALEPQSVKLKDLLEDNTFVIENSIVDLQRSNPHFFQIKTELNEFMTSSDATISNVLAATLTGDLAEAAVRRGPSNLEDPLKYNIGTTGIWNDSILPRNLYLYPLSPGEWEMTDAELLGGIDGFIIAHHIHDWMAKIENIRLSQIIEMYYSNYGMSFDHNIRACNRKNSFLKLLNMEELYEQNRNMVKLLWTRLSGVYLTIEEMEKVSDAAVKAFLTYWPKKLDDLPGCDVRGDISPMEITLVTDGSWPKYEIEQLIATITKILDVSDHGSSLGLLHGSNGEWISLHSNSTLTIYNNIANYTEEWPYKINLATSLSSVLKYLDNSTKNELWDYKAVGLPRVVIISAPSSMLTDVDMSNSILLMRTLRNTYSDVYFLFMMPSEDAFEHLIENDQKSTYMFIETSNTDERGVAEMIRSNFIEKTIPKRFIAPLCNYPKGVNVRLQFEDYIMMGERNVYKIHPQQLVNVAVVNIHFQGTDMGEISVCISRNNTEKGAVSCKIVSGLFDASFQVRHPCDSPRQCDPVYFIVKARSTLIKCADKNCRYPNQVRYIIRHEGLKCSGNDSQSKGHCFKNNLFTMQIIITLSLLMYLLWN